MATDGGGGPTESDNASSDPPGGPAADDSGAGEPTLFDTIQESAAGERTDADEDAEPADEGDEGDSRENQDGLVEHAVDQLRHVLRPEYVLAAMVATYAVVFSVFTVRQHTRFNTSAFDLGIYDQGIWLISRGADPFVTVRGLDFFGNHLNLTTYLLVPLFWLGGGVKTLLIVQSIAMALGAVPLFLYARDRLGDRWLALCPPAAYLLYPALERANAFHFHPEKLAIAPMLFAFWFAYKERWTWFGVSIAFVLLTREDLALTIAMFGIVLFFRKKRDVGLLTLGAAIIWFVVATQLIIPWRNDGQKAFYAGYFATLGETPAEIIKNTVVHPSRVWDTALEPEKQTYFSKMLVPTAGLPLASPTTLVIAGPSLFINTMAEGVDAANINYQYSTMATAVFFAASVDSLAKLRRRKSALRFACGALMVCSVGSNVAWGISPISTYSNRVVWYGTNPNQQTFEEALALVPDDASVTSSYFLVPHLTHRRESYLWPNPFDYQNWGFNDEPTADPDDIDYLVVDPSALETTRDLFEELTGPDGDFEIIFDVDGIMVAHRRP